MEGNVAMTEAWSQPLSDDQGSDPWTAPHITVDPDVVALIDMCVSPVSAEFEYLLTSAISPNVQNKCGLKSLSVDRKSRINAAILRPRISAKSRPRTRHKREPDEEDDLDISVAMGINSLISKQCGQSRFRSQPNPSWTKLGSNTYRDDEKRAIYCYRKSTGEFSIKIPDILMMLESISQERAVEILENRQEKLGTATLEDPVFRHLYEKAIQNSANKPEEPLAPRIKELPALSSFSDNKDANDMDMGRIAMAIKQAKEKTKLKNEAKAKKLTPSNGPVKKRFKSAKDTISKEDKKKTRPDVGKIQKSVPKTSNFKRPLPRDHSHPDSLFSSDFQCEILDPFHTKVNLPDVPSQKTPNGSSYTYTPLEGSKAGPSVWTSNTCDLSEDEADDIEQCNSKEPLPSDDPFKHDPPLIKNFVMEERLQRALKLAKQKKVKKLVKTNNTCNLSEDEENNTSQRNGKDALTIEDSFTTECELPSIMSLLQEDRIQSALKLAKQKKVKKLIATSNIGDLNLSEGEEDNSDQCNGKEGLPREDSLPPDSEPPSIMSIFEEGRIQNALKLAKEKKVKKLVSTINTCDLDVSEDEEDNTEQCNGKEVVTSVEDLFPPDCELPSIMSLPEEDSMSALKLVKGKTVETLMPTSSTCHLDLSENEEDNIEQCNGKEALTNEDSLPHDCTEFRMLLGLLQEESVPSVPNEEVTTKNSSKTLNEGECDDADILSLDVDDDADILSLDVEDDADDSRWFS